MTEPVRVAADLRRRILDGEFPPGTPLREAALAAHYGVARHTVRAALRQLAGSTPGAGGLVEVEPHRGARVAHLGGAALRALFDLRTALEVGAARLLVVPAPTEGWPEAVEAAATRLEAACAVRPAADRAAVDAAHLALHHALVAAAGSPRITAAHADLADESRLALLQSRTTLSLDRMVAAHRELLAGLRSEGPEALVRHLAEGARLATDGGER